MEETDMIIESGCIRMTGGEFIKIAAYRYVFPLFLIFATLLLPVSLLVVLFDIRWLIILFMILFLIIPMVMAYLYFWYGLQKVTVLNTIPHRLAFLERHVEFRFVDENEEICHTAGFTYTDFNRFYVGRGCIIAPLLKKNQGFVFIPTKAFATSQEFKEAVGRIAGGIRQHENNIES